MYNIVFLSLTFIVLSAVSVKSSVGDAKQDVESTGKLNQRAASRKGRVELQANGLNNSSNSHIDTMTVNNYFGPAQGENRNGEDIIANPVITDWGYWGNWDNCSIGQYAFGFQLKTQRSKGPGDDTALNAIRLLCGRPGSFSISKYITSKIGDFGDWGSVFNCNGLLTGFQLRSEPPQGRLRVQDDTAANNMRGICTSPSTGEVEVLEGDGDRWGDWTADQRCDSGKSVCGILTQVESNIGFGADGTALNNVRMKCCDIKIEKSP